MDGGKLKLSTIKGNDSAVSPHIGNFQSKLGVAQLGGYGMVLHHAHWPISERRVWMGLLVLGLIVMYMTRTSMPVAIVEISQELNWDKKTCGIVLSSLYWGYILTQVVGGHIADRRGGDWVLWGAGIVWSLASLSIIYSVYVSDLLVIAARFTTGLFQGVHWPAVTSLLAHRLPASERNFNLSLISAGGHVGVVVTGVLGSLLLFHRGWQWLFVAVGVAGLAWALLLRTVSVRSRSRHKTHYKLSANSHVTEHTLRLEVPPTAGPHTSVPWRKLLQQPPVLALFLAHFSHCFLFHNAISWMPTYFYDTFPDRINSAWQYNVLPWVSMAVGSLLGGWLAEWMVAQNVNMTVVRKTTTTISLGGSSLFLLLMGVVGHGGQRFPPTLLCAILSFGFDGVTVAATMSNPIDLAPSTAGALFGTMNSIGTLPGIFGVSLTGYILQATSSWVLVFSIMAGINLVAVLTFLAFGSGQRLQIDS